MAGNAPSNDLHILKIPLAFFGLHRGTADPPAVQRLENYIARLKKELRRHALKAIAEPNYFLPENFKQALSAMPIALFRVGNEFEMPVDCAAILFEHAYLAFHAYRQRPQEGKSLLDILQSNPEYIYHLLVEEQKNRTRGGPPLTFQLSSGDIVTIQDLEKMLLFHSPHWSILWLQRKFNEAFFRRILQVIVLLKNHDPGCAHCHHWLQTQHLSPEERTAKIVKHLHVIGGNTWYALLTALEHPAADCEPLLKNILESPSWCYNWLKWVRRGPRETLVDKLLESAPWTVQYLVDLEPPDAGQLLERLRQKNTNPWWTEWIDFYAQTQKSPSG
jgi:hypothetical protein